MNITLFLLGVKYCLAPVRSVFLQIVFTEWVREVADYHKPASHRDPCLLTLTGCDRDTLKCFRRKVAVKKTQLTDLLKKKSIFQPTNICALL